MTATQGLTPKQERPNRLFHSVGDSPIAQLATRAGAIWLETTMNGKWIMRARSDRGEEWVARGR